jgi:hypothetical protein
MIYKGRPCPLRQQWPPRGGPPLAADLGNCTLERAPKRAEDLPRGAVTTSFDGRLAQPMTPARMTESASPNGTIEDSQNSVVSHSRKNHSFIQLQMLNPD